MTKTKHRGQRGDQMTQRSVSAGSEVGLKEIFANIDKIRRRIKRRPKSITLKSLITDGRE